MKRTYIVKIDWVWSLMKEIESNPMTLQEIHATLQQKGYQIPFGEIRAVVSAFSMLGMISRSKTWKKNYKYQIEKPEKP